MVEGDLEVDDLKDLGLRLDDLLFLNGDLVQMKDFGKTPLFVRLYFDGHPKAGSDLDLPVGNLFLILNMLLRSFEHILLENGECSKNSFSVQS